MSPQRASVAIITPTHNHEQFIDTCIRSVLAQARSDWEMVIVDDGSTDRTVEIARSYADARITVVQRAGGGIFTLGESYAAGLASTRAPLVAVLEGDDAWPATKLTEQVPHFDDPDVVLSYGPAELIDAYGCSYAAYDRVPGDPRVAQNEPVGSILPALVRQNFIVAATVVVRRSALERAGGFWQPPRIPWVDHPTWLRMALRGTFRHARRTVGYWRRHPRQFTTASAAASWPDLRPYVRDVIQEALDAHLPVDLPALESILQAAPGQRARWTAVSELRLALLDGTFHDAVRAARPLIQSRRSRWMALGALAVAARAVGGDLEWVFRMTNRFSWPSRRHARRHRAEGRKG